MGPLASFAAAPVQQSGQRKPKHSTASLTGRSRLADWPKYLSDDLRRMHQESRANPLQPTAWHERLHAAERRKARSWRGFGDRPGLRKKRRSSDLLASPQEPRAHSDPAHSGASGRDPYKRLTGSALSAAAGFTVDSVRAVQAGSASTSKFLVWLVVFARGLVVQDLAGTRKRRFSAATRQVKVVVHFSTQFAEKHKS